MKVADVMYSANLEIEKLKTPEYKGFPRPVEASEDNEVIWRIKVHFREVSDAAASTCTQASSFSFMHLHSALASAATSDGFEKQVTDSTADTVDGDDAPQPLSRQVSNPPVDEVKL